MLCVFVFQGVAAGGKYPPYIIENVTSGAASLLTEAEEGCPSISSLTSVNNGAVYSCYDCTTVAGNMVHVVLQTTATINHTFLVKHRFSLANTITMGIKLLVVVDVRNAAAVVDDLYRLYWQFLLSHECKA